MSDPAGLIGVLLVLVVVAMALFAPLVAPRDPNRPSFGTALLPPGERGFVLGTDQLGRDVLSRIIYGAQISLLIGFVTVALAGGIGIVVGLLAGYFGGPFDSIAMRFADIQLSFPFILLALVINAIMGLGLQNIMISLVIAGWVEYARVARGEVLALRDREFVQAARVLGGTDTRIIFRHILPNIVTPLIVLTSLSVAQFIIAEASISFLGFGVQPPQAAWGNMLADGRDKILTAWWLITFPGLALALTALAVNMAGDWLRDTLDPRLDF